MLRLRWYVSLLGIVAVAIGSMSAQAAMRFEAASVKPNVSTADLRFGVRPGGRFAAENMPLRMIISLAHQTGQQGQIDGIPEWAPTAKYDIDAKAPRGSRGAGRLTRRAGSAARVRLLRWRFPSRNKD